MFVTICLNPTIQRTLVFRKIEKNAVNRAAFSRVDASGKGANVSRVLCQLGCSVLHLAQLNAAGAPSRWFSDALKADGIKLCAAPCGSAVRTCTTLIEENATTGEALSVTELVEEGEAVRAETEEALRALYAELLAAPREGEALQAVVISGSKAAGFSDSLFADFARAALERGVPVVADYRGKDLLLTLEAAKGCAGGRLVVKPNFEELCATFGDFPRAQPEANGRAADAANAAEERYIEGKLHLMWREYGAKGVVTRGTGDTLAFDGEKLYRIACERVAFPRKVRNTIGCGDAFTAGFASVWAGGGAFEAALKKGGSCAALNAQCLRPGSILVDE